MSLRGGVCRSGIGTSRSSNCHLICVVVVILSLVNYPFRLGATTVASGTAATTGGGQTIGYQVHSWNDLDEWDQALTKLQHQPRYAPSSSVSSLPSSSTNPKLLNDGQSVWDHWLKIDPHYMPMGFCQTQSQVPKNDPRGCHILNHDDPVPQTQYNSTQDLIRFLKDPARQRFFQQTNFRTYIALCFKYDGQPCDNSQTSQNWLSLVDELILELNQTVQKYNLNVEFVLDGSGTPTEGQECIWKRWRPLVATWILDPWEALFSNDRAYAYDRFQIPNPPVAPYDPSLPYDLLAFFDYGKFASTEYPFLIWEPSDQASIHEVERGYLFDGTHPQGFRFAINIDPVQFQVYAAHHSGTALNHRLHNTYDPTSDPHIVVFSNNTGTGFISVLHNLPNHPQNTIEVFQHHDRFSIPISLGTRSLPTSTIIGVINSVSLDQSHNAIFVTDSNSNYLLYRIHINYDNLQKHQEKQKELPKESYSVSVLSAGNLDSFSQRKKSAITTTLASTILINENENTNNTNTNTNNKDGNITMAQLFSTSGCDVAIQFYEASGTASKGYQIGYASAVTCLEKSTTTTTNKNQSVAITGATLTLTNVTSKVCAPFFGKKQRPGSSFVGLALYSTTDANIYASAFCVSASGYVVHPLLPSSLLVDIGQNPSMATMIIDNQAYFIETHGEGYCWNSETRNKRPYPKLCKSQPVSSPFILTYNYGRLDDLLHHLLNSQTNKNIVPNENQQNYNNNYGNDSVSSSPAFLTSCNERILHGMYDMGSAPSVALFSISPSGLASSSSTPSSSSSLKIISMLEVHRGLVSYVETECGSALPHNGLLLDAWPLPPLPSS